MSRSRKGAPCCPSYKCNWCGGLAAAKHRDARRAHYESDGDCTETFETENRPAPPLNDAH